MSRNCGYGGGNVDIGEFDLDTLITDKDGNPMCPRIALIAPSGSGKSYIIRNIMYHMHKNGVGAGTVIAPTSKMNRFFEEFIPECFIHHEFKNEILQNCLDRQRYLLELNNDRKKKGKRLTNDLSFLIMDDCMSSKHLWLKDPNILLIFNEGRHYKLMPFILSMQYSVSIQPELRSNFDFVFLLAEDKFSNIRKLYDHYAGVFPKFDLFEQVFSQITDDYGCMVINNRLNSKDITKKVKWFRAKTPKPFMMGSKRVLKFNEEHFDEDHGKKKDTVDLMGICGGRKQIIKVNMRSSNE